MLRTSRKRAGGPEPPDLFASQETGEARRLYELYLSCLMVRHRHEDMVRACRTIRGHARRGPGTREGVFTYWYEINALCSLGKYPAAWRALTRRDALVHGKRMSISGGKKSLLGTWTEITCHHAPILYFLGRYRRGCALLETALDAAMRSGRQRSYELLFRVFKPEREPGAIHRVTLRHFYDRLGRSLDQWRHWARFLEGFHPRMFTLARVDREDLLLHPERMEMFFNRLMRARAERTGHSMIGRGEKDLLEAPSRVRRWHLATRRKMVRWARRSSRHRNATEEKLRALFPDLVRP